MSYGLLEKDLLGYVVEFLPIGDFKNYYTEQYNTFNSFSEKAFLKSAGIPPAYFLEQPEDTKAELLLNQEDIIPEKYPDKHILLLKKDGFVQNCCRLDFNVAEVLYDRINPSNKFNLTPVKDFIKEGYSSVFIFAQGEEKGKYNLGLFVDYPIMLNKPPQVHTGMYYVPEEGEDHYKSLYLDTIEVDFNDYNDLDLLIEDYLGNVSVLSREDIIESLSSTLVLKEVEEVLGLLAKEKVFPKSYVRKISKYAHKNGLLLTSVMSYINLILEYEDNVKGYKSVSRLRQVRKYLLDILLEKESM